jgi:hypothetical protein
MLIGCGDEGSTRLGVEDYGKTVLRSVGEPIELGLGGVGPGYGEPMLSGDALVFEGSEVEITSSPPTPGGGSRLHVYRFRCASAGEVHVTVRKLGTTADEELSDLRAPPFEIDFKCR